MPSKSIYTIYRVTCSVNLKQYVGWTTRKPEQRFREHMTNPDPKGKMILASTVKKYGSENFTLDVLYQSWDYDHSREMEGHFIRECHSLVTEHGYNVDFGGKGHKRSPSTIEKHRKKMIGRKQSEEHRRKRGEAIRGEKNGMWGKKPKPYERNKQYRQRMSESKKRKNAERKANDTFIPPKPLSAESIEKMRATKLASRHKTAHYRDVVIEDPQGIQHQLGYEYQVFLKEHGLNNFLTKCSRTPGLVIKGYRLISFKHNR